MSIVPMWTGQEIRILREARRTSVRAFAEHLGVSGRMVSKWEAGGEKVWPRPLNQAALDTSLAMAGLDVRSRFANGTNSTNGVARKVGASAARRKARAQVMMPDGAVNYLRHPIDGKLMTLVEAGPFRTGRGRNTVWLPAYYIDVRPTTNVEYLRFLGATDHCPHSIGQTVVTRSPMNVARLTMRRSWG